MLNRWARALTMLVVLTMVAWAPADIRETIRDRAAAHGVSGETMIAVAECESSLDPHATNGRYKGLFQLGSPGMEDEFWEMGYTDIWSAWQQADFAALQFARGRSSAWSCA